MTTRMNLNVTLADAAGAESTTVISATMADLARYDIYRAKNAWPGRTEAEFLFLCIVAYSTLVRTGKVNANLVSPEKFLDTVVGIEMVDDELASEGAEKS